MKQIRNFLSQNHIIDTALQHPVVNIHSAGMPFREAGKGRLFIMESFTDNFTCVGNQDKSVRLFLADEPA